MKVLFVLGLLVFSSATSYARVDVDVEDLVYYGVWGGLGAVVGHQSDEALKGAGVGIVAGHILKDVFQQEGPPVSVRARYRPPEFGYRQHRAPRYYPQVVYRKPVCVQRVPRTVVVVARKEPAPTIIDSDDYHFGVPLGHTKTNRDGTVTLFYRDGFWVVVDPRNGRVLREAGD